MIELIKNDNENKIVINFIIDIMIRGTVVINNDQDKV